MSRKLAAPLSCPADLTVALARRGSDAERERLLEHVEGCAKCLKIIATNTREPAGQSNERDIEERDDLAPFIAVGDILAEKYRVVGLIGSGAMGSVYRARHVGLGSDVAIKVLRPERLHDVNAERRFSREARATSSLRSPHAIRTFDIDRLPSGVPYIVMEYLEGADLAAIVNTRGALPIAEAVRYIIDACDAVGEAHGLSIIHRDIKPANLFLTTAGVLKVLDFGLAKNLPQLLPDAGSEATKTNFLLGSPHYMSPEQLRSAKEVDARADIWSLGATLFHLLCGAPPFFGTNLYVLIALILNDDAPTVKSKLPEAPAALDAVVAKCLRRDREDRYPSCAALRRALEDVLAGGRGVDSNDPTRQFAPNQAAQAALARRQAERTVGAQEAKAALAGDSDLGDSGEMFRSTLDAPVPTVPNPAIAVRSSDAIISFAEPADDADPTVAAESPYASADAPAPPSALPRLYEEEPFAEPGEQAGTMLMPQTIDRLIAKAPGGVPRVYDDDVELLPDVTKLMLESPPHLRPPSQPVFPAWNVTVPLAVPPPKAVIPAPIPRASAAATVARKAAAEAPPSRASHIGGILLVGFSLLLLIAALFTLWTVR